MCGRYTLTELEKFTDPRRHRLTIVPFGFTPRYNIAPTQDSLVILDADPTTITTARWGLIPAWAADPGIGYRMINARAETVAEKPAFKRLFKRRRCLVLADGFYEWKRFGAHKVPYRITLTSGAPFAFAGLWDTWEDRDARRTLTTFTIITTTANRVVKPIHDRMPVILTEADEEPWLRPGLTDSKARAFLKPHPADGMEAAEASPLVNSARNTGPDVLRPIGRLTFSRRSASNDQ